MQTLPQHGRLSVDLSHNSIGDEGIICLQNLLPPNLVTLNIGYNDIIADNPFFLLNMLDNLPNLMVLNLEGNNITDDTIYELSEWLQRADRNLRIIHIGGNPINHHLAKTIAHIAITQDRRICVRDIQDFDRLVDIYMDLEKQQSAHRLPISVA